MLAFTVQFSRYGRNHAYSVPVRDLSARPFEVSPAEAAASSGPNSVLTQSHVPCARSAAPPKRAAYWPRLRAAAE
jgi:hypothetical protein